MGKKWDIPFQLLVSRNEPSYQLSFLTMRNELSSPSLKLMGSVEKEKEILRWQIFYSVVEADLQWHIKEGCVRFHSQLKAI